MQKFLFIHFLNAKQKENQQTPTKVLNVGLSIMIMLLAVIFTGKQIIGFLSAEPINGKDLLGSVLLIYGTLNLIYSWTIDYELKYEKTKLMAMGEKSSELILTKKSNKELNILPMISYADQDRIKKKDSKHITTSITEKKQGIISAPVLTESKKTESNPTEATPDEILLEQFQDMEENFHIYEETEQIDENALPLSTPDSEPIVEDKLSKQEKLTNFLADLL